MKTILLLLLMQAMTGNRPFTRSVFQGETIILQLTEQQCSGTIAVFSRAYVCRPDNSIVVGVDFLAQPNTYTVTDDDAPIGTLLVMARSYRTRHLSSRACKLSPEKCISLKERRAQ
ncbi:MAG: hypothetical protein AAB910_00645, partial [Patescibacteria group bacterium]